MDSVNNIPNGEVTIDLLEIARLLLRKIWIPIIAAVACGAITFGYCEFVVPAKYTSETKLYVANSDSGSDEKSYSDVQVASRLANSYKVIFKSDTVCSSVSKQLGGKYSPKEINSMITVTTSTDSEIINLSVTTTSAKDAQIIAGYVFQYGRQEIMRIIRAGWVEYIDEPSLPTSKSSPSVKRNSALAALVGALVACGIIVAVELLSNKVKSKKDLTDAFKDVPIIGVIPVIRKADPKKGGAE